MARGPLARISTTPYCDSTGSYCMRWGNGPERHWHSAKKRKYRKGKWPREGFARTVQLKGHPEDGRQDF